MPTTRERNQKYYQENKEKENARSLAYYHQNKDKIDRDAQRAYMKEYRKSHPKKPRTQQEKEARRSRYQSDPVYRAKMLERAKQRHRANPNIKRAHRLKAAYFLTIEEYETILKSQHGRCAICGTDQPGAKGFAVDHDHFTEAIRGILCPRCNVGLGQFQDSPALLRKASEYLVSRS